MSTAKCSLCGRELPASRFQVRRNGKPRRDCKQCVNKRQGAWSKARRRSDAAYGVYITCRGVDWTKRRANDLTLEYVRCEIAKPCRYCGTTDRFRSLDRKDSAIGHTQANSVSCCVRCNMIKRDMPEAAWAIVADGVRKAEKAGLFGEWSPGNFLRNTPAAKAKAVDEAS
jgi:hypothetical protein